MNKKTTLLISSLLALLLIGFVSVVNGASSVKGAKASHKTANESWHVRNSSQPEIVILDKVVRSDHPSQLFGFNINFRQFQKQLWTNEQMPKEGIIDALKPFNGAIYRYPGGSVANSFHWKASVGPIVSRAAQSSFYQKNPAKVLFGLDEYLRFVESVSGKPWYVLNIVGTNLSAPLALSTKDEMAHSNLGLVKYLLAKLDKKDYPLHLQLGNEVDRSKYEWTAEQYVERAKAVVDIIEENNLESRFTFVNFMRDFKWKYRRDPKLGVSKPKDYLREVIEEFGKINDYSLHHYYDGKREDGKSRSIPFWLRHLSGSIQNHLEITGQPASIWITEHGRQPNSVKAGRDGSKAFTSNVAAALSTADYLIALAQFAEVKGAVWHGLNAGPWQLFDYSVKHKDLRPRPIYWGLRVLRMISLQESLMTITHSPNNSGYAGGYDIRGAAFRSDDGNEVGLRVVNRAPLAQKLKLKYELFAKLKISYKHYSLSLPADEYSDIDRDDFIVELDPKARNDTFDENGYVYFDLPASSVSSIVMQAAQ